MAASPGRRKSFKSGGQKVPGAVRGKSGRFKRDGQPPAAVKDAAAVEDDEDSDEPAPLPRGGTKSGLGRGSRKTRRPEKRGESRASRATDGDRSGGTPAGPGGLDLVRASGFRRGLPIAVKFAIPTAATVAFFMALLGYLTYSITYREIDGQIDERGIALTLSIAALADRAIWEVPEDLKDILENPDDALQLKAAEDELLDRRKALEESLEPRLRQIVASSDGEIINVLLVRDFRTTPGQMASGEGANEEISIGELVKTKDIGLVEIFEARYSRGDTDVRSRQYRRPIDPDHPLAKNDGVYVFLKADRIDEVTKNLRTRIALITAIGAIAGIILAVIIAMVLTGPIRSLERDITIVSGGNLDHNTIPRSRDEIGSLAHSFNVMTQNLMVAQANAVEREAIERELSIATEIQTKLLPERIPQIPGVDIHSFYLSAKEVGGDYYDFLVLDQQHLGIIVADVSGKGIPGSMVMTMFRSLVRLASVRNTSPSDTFKKVNRILAKDIRRGMFVTAVYMILDVQNKTLKVASAGHNPSVLYRAKTNTVELINPQGIALGFDKGPIFDNHIREQEIVLEEGDRITAYTDGVTEAMSEKGDEYGDEPFYDLVRETAKKSSKDFVASVVESLEGHRGRAEQSDDITVTTLAIQS